VLGVSEKLCEAGPRVKKFSGPGGYTGRGEGGGDGTKRALSAIL